MGWYTPLAMWVIYGGMALCCVVCIGVIARALWVPSDLRRQCCCGGCRYPITDTTPGRCPECGAILSKVGVSTPGLVVRLRGSLGWALLAWTALLAMSAGPAWMWLEQMAMMNSMTVATGMSGKMQTVRDTSYRPNRYASGMNVEQPERGVLDFRIDANHTYVEDGMVVESGDTKLVLRQDGTAEVATLHLNIEGKSFVLRNMLDNEVRSGPFEKLDDSVIKEWFEAAGIATGPPSVKVAMSDALKIAKMCVVDIKGLESGFTLGTGTEAGELQSGGGSSSSSSMATGFGSVGSPIGVPFYVLTGVGGGIYLVGCLLIVWRHRRLLD